SQATKLSRESVDVVALVRDVAERLGPSAEGRFLTVHTEGDAIVAFVDRARIERVLENVIGNAIKYSDPNSEITLGVGRSRGEARIAVTNRGQGISEADLTHVFERYFRVRRARSRPSSGLGLGLYIARGLVEAHGGRIWAESTPGARTTFHIALPIEP